MNGLRSSPTAPPSDRGPSPHFVDMTPDPASELSGPTQESRSPLRLLAMDQLVVLAAPTGHPGRVPGQGGGRRTPRPERHGTGGRVLDAADLPAAHHPGGARLRAEGCTHQLRVDPCPLRPLADGGNRTAPTLGRRSRSPTAGRPCGRRAGDRLGGRRRTSHPACSSSDHSSLRRTPKPCIGTCSTRTPPPSWSSTGPAA